MLAGIDSVIYARWHKTRSPGFAYIMSEFVFQPIKVNATAPSGACVLRTFDDIGTFILTRVDIPRRLSRPWHPVRQGLVQARFGVRCAEVHAATRYALSAEGWLAE
jgi:hypothetical protein